MNMKLLDHAGLREKGIGYSKTQIWRLCREGKFPKPVRGIGKANAWSETEIDAFIAERLAARDAQPAAPVPQPAPEAPPRRPPLPRRKPRAPAR
jgi:prophage regulatory protein